MEEHEIGVGSKLRELCSQIIGIPADPWEVVCDVPPVNADAHSWFLHNTWSGVAGEGYSSHCAVRGSDRAKI